MIRGPRRASWTLLALALLFFPLLIPLTAFVLQPLVAESKQAVSQTVEVRIMPLGDSITYGQGSSNGGGYRWPLWHDLRARGIQVIFVGSMQHGPVGFNRDNEGLPGWKIRQIAASVVGWLRTYQPQIILLHIGTNDFIKDDDPAHAAARLKSLIEQITTTLPRATLLIAQIIPVVRVPQWNEEVLAYNAALPALVQAEAAQGRHVQLVDMYDAVPASFLPDGVHPNDQASELMALAWEKALLPLLKPGNNRYS